MHDRAEAVPEKHILTKYAEFGDGFGISAANSRNDVVLVKVQEVGVELLQHTLHSCWIQDQDRLDTCCGGLDRTIVSLYDHMVLLKIEQCCCLRKD